MKFAREGIWHLAAALALAILLTITAGWWSLPMWAAVIFVVQFFRDPVRRPPADDDSIAVAPADGRVVFVGESPDPCANSPSLKISIFMSPFNVHVNRAPISGRVTADDYHPGKFFNAALDKSSAENERRAIRIDGVNGGVTCVQVAGFIARRILCYVKKDDAVQLGNPYGFIRFGSRVDVYLPTAAAAAVAVGEKVCGGETIIGRFGGN